MPRRIGNWFKDASKESGVVEGEGRYLGIEEEVALGE
jgi:hypothetical protein